MISNVIQPKHHQAHKLLFNTGTMNQVNMLNFTKNLCSFSIQPSKNIQHIPSPNINLNIGWSNPIQILVHQVSVNKSTPFLNPPLMTMSYFPNPNSIKPKRSSPFGVVHSRFIHSALTRIQKFTITVFDILLKHLPSKKKKKKGLSFRHKIGCSWQLLLDNHFAVGTSSLW